MDIVIDSQHPDLKTLIRSIEKYVMDYNEIVIVGEKPYWIQGVIHIPHSHATDKKWKEKNVYDKVSAACLHSDVSFNFVFIDNGFRCFYETTFCKNLRWTYFGTCRGSSMALGTIEKLKFKRTSDFLLRRGFRDFNAEWPSPIIFNKREFLCTFEEENWRTPYGYCMKSLYCAVNKKPMTRMIDPLLLKETEEKFTEKSSYEI